ncbi:MAG: GlsB/YeaQ/YmgE family stress response membrane protein [Chloroflexi bacterium]|nr:GlsB/YeaQ/YmgE family stress response membrane protein [Chloroflexota bacterium]
MNILVFLLVGLIAGWLAGQISQGKGYGCIGNILIGVLGAFVGGFVLDLLNINLGGGEIVNAIITSLIGALTLIFITRIIT